MFPFKLQTLEKPPAKLAGFDFLEIWLVLKEIYL